MDGTFIVPDSISLEDLEVAFDTTSQVTYSFDPIEDDDDDEIIVVKKDTIDLNPEIFQAVLYEVPMSITRVPRDQYPKGDGWQVLSENDEPDEDEIDPRWEKLKEFKLDDD
nr:YceD family protein [Catenisphaera adipataccumulans]